MMKVQIFKTLLGLAAFLGFLLVFVSLVLVYPADLFLMLIYFADWLFRLMNLTIISYAFAYVMMKRSYFIFSFIFAIVAVVVSSHIIISDFGLAKYFSEPHTVRVLSQKAATIALIISVPLMTIYNRKRLASHPITLKIFTFKNISI